MYIMNCSPILISVTAEELKKIVGVNIKKERLRCNLTQPALAEIIGMSIKQVAAIETGHSYPEAATLAKLSNALGVPPSFFFRRPGDNEEEKERVLSHFRNIQTKLELILDEEAADYSSPEKR